MNIKREIAQRERISDRELLDLMERDPQAGMEAAMEQYTGLLWRISEKYLQDPEDIKECINDTFLELCIHRDRFDPEKGSLTAYLAQITRNLSISRYRKNAARSDMPAAHLDESASAQELLEAQIDLERAMNSLKPEDAEIIRMKYYGGMTVREIAASLNLPYDTVKKRHQRSLSKLKTLLLGILVLALLALLAACAYTLLRYFGIVPGYGISEDPEALVFTLEEPVQREGESGTYLVFDAMLLNDKMYILLNYYPASQEIMEELTYNSSVFQTFERGANRIPCTLNGEPVDEHSESGATAFWNGSSVARYEDHWTITLDLRLTDPKALPRWDEGIEAAFTLFDIDFTCRLVQVKADQVSDYPHQIAGRGGLLAIPRLEEGRLIVGIYPLSTGSETVLTSLVRGRLMEGKKGDVTVTAPDGQELVGACVMNSTGSHEYFCDWDFGLAQPGNYTLHVPYVYLTVPVEEPFTFRLDLQRGTWEDQEIQLSGGTLSIESCQPLDLSIGEPIPGLGGPFTVQEGCRTWTLRLRYDASEDMVMTGCYLSPDEKMDRESKVLYDVAVGEDGNFVPFKTNGFGCTPVSAGEEDNIMELSIWGWDGCYDPSNVLLTIAEPLSMRWEHSFDLPLVVEAK